VDSGIFEPFVKFSFSPGCMTSTQAGHELFMAKVADTVMGTASSIADSLGTESRVQVYCEPYEWGIRSTVASGDQHRMQEVLNAAKAHFQDTCRSTNCLCLVSSMDDSWEGSNYVSVLARVEHCSRADTPTCEFHKCTNPECPEQHDSLINRLYITVKISMMVPKCASCDSSSSSTFSAASAANSASDDSSLSDEGSISGDEGSIIGADGLLPPAVHEAYDTKFGIQAHPTNQSSFDFLIRSPLQPSCVISL